MAWGGRTIDKVRRFDLTEVERFKPDVVFLQIGTNGLTRRRSSPASVGSVGSLMCGSVRGCHTDRVFHCELFSLSLTIYITIMLPCTTLSICYLPSFILAVFSLIFLGVLSSGSWWGGHTLCALWRLFLPHLFREKRDI